MSIMAIIFLTTSFWLPAAASGESIPIIDLKAQNYQKAADNIAAQVVAKLPDDVHFRLLGIGPIEGDNGQLNDALTSKIKAETQYHLIERKDLDKILEEQGVQLSPIADDRGPVEPGKIKGVEGLLMGKIVKEQCSFLFCSLDIFIKLDDVEGGEVVFAENFKAQFLPPSTIYGFTGSTLLILFILYAIWAKARKKEKSVQFVQSDAGKLQALQNELKKARDNLNRAHDDLVAKDKINTGVAVREVRENLNSLLFKLEQEPGVHPEAIEKNVKSDLKAHGKAMSALVKKILAASEKVLQASRSGDESGIQSAAEALKTEIESAANRLHERSAGRA